MTKHLRPTLAAATLLLGSALALPALAENFFPRVTAAGENIDIDYGPAPRGNIVGGGRAEISIGADQPQVRYLDPAFVQTPPAGQVPVVEGNAEANNITWVPARAATGSRGVRGPARG